MPEKNHQNPFKILIASDSRLEKSILMDGVKRAFGGDSFHVIEMCSRGDEALSCILSSSPDMVFVDWIMPGMEGPEVCRLVRQAHDGQDDKYCYIFITTSRGDKKSILHGLSSGADDFITKPFDSEEITTRISVGIRFLRAYREVCRQKEEIDLLSRTDVLTGNLNRRSIMVAMDRALDSSRDDNTPISVCLCDLDFFKRINDDYGHQAGDFVLRKVGYIFNDTIKGMGHVGRYGGDEFLFLFPAVDFFSLVKAVKEIYHRVKDESFVFDGVSLPVSLSCGVAYVSNPMKDGMWTSGTLIKVADDALYEAKRRGKGRTCMCDGSSWSENGKSNSAVFQDLA